MGKEQSDGKKGVEETASPQQPDGISNIRSWNVRNAGQSDLTEGEGGEDRRVRKDKKKKKKKWRYRKEWHSRRAGRLNTGWLCEHKNTESLFVEGVARDGTNN